MSDMRSLALTRAYELVEAGKSEEARTVLEPILLNDRDNVDAWWIYAHAVDDPAEARRALDHVIRLDRDYPGAAELMATLNAQYPEEVPKPLPAAVTEPEIADLEPEFADDDSYVEEQRYTPVTVPPREERSRSWLPIALVLGILAVLFIVLVLLLPNLNQGTTATPTALAALPTTEPTALIVVPSTEEATDMVFLPEMTEVVLLDVTPLGEATGAATEAVEMGATTVAGLPEETEAVEVDTTTAALPTEREAAEVQPGEADATEPAEVEPDNPSLGEATPTEAVSVALGVTEVSQRIETTTPAEEVSPTAEESLGLQDAEETAEPVIEPQPTEAEAETAAPTELAEETEEPSASLEVTIAVEPESAAEEYTERLETALQSFATAEPAVEELETEFGETVLVRVCTTEGLELRETLRTVMELVANEAETLPETLSGVGARLINCDMDRTLRIIAVDRESAAAYATDELDDTQFEANWRAQ